MLLLALRALLSLQLFPSGGAQLALAPRFTLEPAARVVYAARDGASVSCAAHGDPPPALAWLDRDHAPLRDVPGLRRVHANGTLEVLPAARAGLTAPAAAVVRCRASNVHGATFSRDVLLQPVEEQSWQAVLEGSSAALGGVAALRCRAPAADAVTDYLWYRGDAPLHVPAPSPDSRYVVAGDTLLIRDVRREDAGAYACSTPGLPPAARGGSARSRPALLAVTESGAEIAPRLTAAPAELAIPRGAAFCMSCSVGAAPPPHYTWLRSRDGRLAAAGGDTWAWAGGAALCGRAEPALQGAWLCKASNARGDGTRQLRLHVVGDAPELIVTPDVVATVCLYTRLPERELELQLPDAARAAQGVYECLARDERGVLRAQATAELRLGGKADALPAFEEGEYPPFKGAHIVAETGGSARFVCTARGAGSWVLGWLHDGAAAGAGAELQLRGAARAAQGVYQCVARDERGVLRAQATAELRLGDSIPELVYTFIEQALRGGGAVSLRCAASGAPSPRVTWLRDGQPIDTHRYAISSESTARGDVVSTLNVTAAQTGDGGRYTCRASNRLGHAEHSARLNIYGPPMIRTAGPIRVVAGANATVYCPYAGYPISEISWWRRGAGGALGGTGRVSARGGSLRLAPALAADAGHYTCSVAAPPAPTARQDIEIQVRNPPKISPFIFSSELTEGSSVQVLCGVSSGDKPMYFSWLKDGAPLPSNLQIEEKSLNEFSLLMFSELSARHSGAYTCRVSNHAATVNFTAALSVKVTPAWVKEPLDVAFMLGAPVLLECAARGHPTPSVTWHRRIGDSLGLESEQWEPVDRAWGGTEGGGGGLRARDGVLTARTAIRSHQGVYRCTADNGVGPPLVKHVNLTVHEPAHFEAGSGNVSSVRGRSAALTCAARGDAPLAVHWSHRGTRLDLNSYRWTVSEVRTVTGGAGGTGGLRSTLQLRAAERADAGEYRCHAHNHYGTREQLMFLHVEEPPEAPRGVRLGGVGSRWVRVQWSGEDSSAHYSALCTALHALPGAEPPHAAFNLTIERTEPSSADTDGTRTLAAKLEGLRPAAAYSLRIVAGNHVGRSPHSEPVMFTTLEEAPSAPPQNVRVRPTGSGELHVTWSAPVQDSWNGELLGYVARWREVGRGGVEVEGRLAARGWSSAELALDGLRPAARYAVTLRAYNRAGAGPPAPAVYAATLDGASELPPESVVCEATSGDSLRVKWSRSPASASSLRGYDVHYFPVQPSTPWSGAAESQSAAGGAGSVTLRGLQPATNYSVWVRARGASGPAGEPSPPVYCVTGDDVPGAVTSLRALAAGADALLVTWLAPARAAGITHYTLHTKELGKAGGEWSQRVEAGGEEVAREVRGLRAAVYSVWVVAHAGAGAAPPSRRVSTAPAEPVSARISSFGREVVALRGSRVVLPCAAVGAAPLRRRWTPPPPPAHSLSDAGELVLHEVVESLAINYTCYVRNPGGADSVTHRLVVRTPPAAPAPRLQRAEPHALLVAWDSPRDNGAPVIGYSVTWGRWESSGVETRRTVPRGEETLALRGLACGAEYRVTLQAHNALGTSPHSTPLRARTKGEKAAPALGAEFVWANSTALRLNLLAWRARCPQPSYSVALRRPPAPFAPLPTDSESALATGLAPAAWYEVRVVARSAAGDTIALYRAATLATSGERIGEPAEVPVEARVSGTELARPAAGGAGWRAGAAPALLGGSLAALLAAITGAAVVRRRGGCGAGRAARPALGAPAPHPQLYSTEPAKRNGKALTPPPHVELEEISPYATFSMAAGAQGERVSGGGCALHLHTFGRAESMDLAAPPPRRHPAHPHTEYGVARDSDSESSGSGCAVCAPPPPLYRAPAPAAAAATRGRAPLGSTSPHGPPLDSSAEDADYSAGTHVTAGARQAARQRRRRDPPHARHAPPGPTVRYTPESRVRPR